MPIGTGLARDAGSVYGVRCGTSCAALQLLSMAMHDIDAPTHLLIIGRETARVPWSKPASLAGLSVPLYPSVS